MPFGFGHLITVVSAMHPGATAGTVEMRLKYLQRLPFPVSDAKVGKGGRIYYEAADVMKVVVALELLAVGVVPAHAAGLVEGCWGTIGEGFAKAWSMRSDPIFSILLRARLDSLDADRAAPGAAEILSVQEAVTWGRSGDAAGRCSILLDLKRTAAVLEGAFEAKAEDGSINFHIAAMRRDVDAWADLNQPASAKMGT